MLTVVTLVTVTAVVVLQVTAVVLVQSGVVAIVVVGGCVLKKRLDEVRERLELR